MEIIKQDRRTRAASAAERWREHFGRGELWSEVVRERERAVHEQLVALGTAPDPDDVNKVITAYYERMWAGSPFRPTWLRLGTPYTYWTDPPAPCDECGVKADVMGCLNAGGDSDGDDVFCHVCAACVAKAAKMVVDVLKGTAT